jgi:hypothetical protein
MHTGGFTDFFHQTRSKAKVKLLDDSFDINAVSLSPFLSNKFFSRFYYS